MAAVTKKSCSQGSVRSFIETYAVAVARRVEWCQLASGSPHLLPRHEGQQVNSLDAVVV